MSDTTRSSAAENSNSGVSSQSQDVSRKTWYFTFDLLASEAGVKSQLDALQSSNKLTNTTILSFSYSHNTDATDWSSDNVVHIRGFISGDTTRRSSVKKLLTNSEISNLELHPISDRYNDPLIISFLKDSALSGAVPAAGDSAIQGRRLRVDTMKSSDAPRVWAGGSPRKRPPAQQQQQQLRPAPATAGAPAPAPRSTGSAQPPFCLSAAGRGWSMGGAAAAEPPLFNWSSSWPQPAATPGEWQPAT